MNRKKYCARPWPVAADLLLALVTLKPVVGLSVEPVDDSPAINTAPGIIVMSPVSDLNQNHLQLAATFLVTGDITANSRLVATAILPAGEEIILRDFSPQPASSRCSPCRTDGSHGPFPCCMPTSYPLTGFGLPTASLPMGTQVVATLVPSPEHNSKMSPFLVRTAPAVRGIEQSADRLRIRIAGAFTVGIPAYLYFGLWPVPVRPEAVSVLPNQIEIDLARDPRARRWSNDLYPITIYQPGAVCDTVLLRFRSPLDPR